MAHGTANVLSLPRLRSLAATGVVLLLAPMAGCGLRAPEEFSTRVWGGGASAQVASAAARAPFALPALGPGAAGRNAGHHEAIRAPKARPVRVAGAADLVALQALVDRARTRPAAVGRADARFAWPASGEILTAFGRQPNGSRNDGIDIAAPDGATVLAADAGTVIYAGNGVAGQGSMLMVRHADDYTTVYAHTHDLLVAAGDLVVRRQPIARLDRENLGPARLHFQLRSAGAPVDPVPFLLPEEAVVASIIQHPSQQRPGWRER